MDTPHDACGTLLVADHKKFSILFAYHGKLTKLSSMLDDMITLMLMKDKIKSVNFQWFKNKYSSVPVNI